LKYLHENGCHWTENYCYYASENGHLEVLKYLHENGCSWNEKCCRNASLKGHLEELKYLYENECPWNESCCILKIFYLKSSRASIKGKYQSYS